MYTPISRIMFLISFIDVTTYVEVKQLLDLVAVGKEVRTLEVTWLLVGETMTEDGGGNDGGVVALEVDMLDDWSEVGPVISHGPFLGFLKVETKSFLKCPRSTTLPGLGSMRSQGIAGTLCFSKSLVRRLENGMAS